MWKKIAALMVLVTTASLLVLPCDVEARGGRGGGGGGGRGGGGARGGAGGGARGGGGAYKGGQAINRTPSMSRPTSRPAASQARQQIQSRPSDLRGQQARQTLQQRPSAANRTELRNQINDYSQRQQVQNIDRQVLSQKTQNFTNNRTNQIAQNRQLSERVSQRIQQTKPELNNMFDRNFFDRHNIDVDYVGSGANWWRPAAWGTLATWGAWNWSIPFYYDDYGYGYPLTTTGSTTTTSPTYTQPTQTAQTTATAGGNWLPLGVFAVANNANSAAQAHRFMQLAVNRSGEIAGVLYNSTTDAAHDLTGKVDPNTQKAYWSLTNKPDSPIASTGIYNLTEDQTPINVKFSDGSTQNWTLVRLQQPK